MKVNSPKDSNIIIQKLPSDIGIHRNPRKGTLNAPKVLLEEFDFKKKVLIEEVFPNEFNLEETHRRIKDNTRGLIEYRKPIISIGGDHSVSFGVIKALKNEYPDMKLVWLDSHLDLKEKVDGHVSHDVVVRELLKNGFSPEEIYFVGITRRDQDEKDFIRDKAFNIFGPNELEDFRREFKYDEQPVYLSIDIDVVKKDLAPGTGYPDGELDLEETKEIIETVQPSFGDIVEIAPPLDKNERTVKSGRKILRNLIETIE